MRSMSLSGLGFFAGSLGSVAVALVCACSGQGEPSPPPPVTGSAPSADEEESVGSAGGGQPDEADDSDEAEATRSARASLVDTLRAEGIRDDEVLAAIGRVQRHRIVPEEVRRYAYLNRPLPIGHDQTISQPFVVALMTQLADISSGDRVLEVGTGSGYQAAVLAELGAWVYSVEIVPQLGRRARQTLDDLGYGDRVTVRIGDGYAGWPDEAPFDAIVLTAAPPEIPAPLKAQLAPGGKLVAPVGPHGAQRIVVLTKTDDGLERAASIPVRFVPMTGRAQEPSPAD